MLLIIGVILTLTWISWKEIPFLWKQHKRKELWIVASLTLIICVLGILKSLSVHLPNPLEWVAAILGPYAKWVYSLLQ